MRDLAAERELLAGLDLPYGELPQLADPDGRRRPAAHALLGDVHAAQFVHGLLPRLIEQGVAVETDGEVVDYRPAESDPEVTVSTAASSSDPTESSDWFDLHIQVRVDGELVPSRTCSSRSARGEFLILETGVYLPLDDPTLDRLRELIEEARSLQDRDRPGQLRISRFQTALWDELTQVGVVLGQADRGSRRCGPLLRPTPTGWPTRLRGRAGGLRAPSCGRTSGTGSAGWPGCGGTGLGGMLADDMGLGKTIQTLAMIAYARRAGRPDAAPFLVVAPTSVVTTWATEAARFAPEPAT